MNLRVGIITCLVVGFGFFFLKKSIAPRTDLPKVKARLSDVRGLPIGAPVTIAGLNVGSIVNRRIGTRYAEIEIQLNSDISLREDATLHKRRISMLSGPSLEIDPGQSLTPLSGLYIQRVKETSPMGDILYDISQALPTVSHNAEVGTEKIERFRSQVNGPFRDQLLDLASQTETMQKTMNNRLVSMNLYLEEAQNFSFNAAEAINPFFERSEELSIFAKENLAKANTWITQSAQDTRATIDDSVIDWQPYADPIQDLDDGKGLLGKELNRSETHDDIVEITNSTRTFIHSLASWKMRVGLQTEYGIRAGARTYVTVKAGRTNRYFYVELLKASNGSKPQVEAQYDGQFNTWRRHVSIKNTLKLTAQWAHRVGPIVFRYGLKESSFGMGADLRIIDNRLEVSADVFEFGQADKPHIKVAATYRIFSQIYILAGLDDILNQHRTISVETSTDKPQTFDTAYFGRDLYFGMALKFNDKDLANLMRIGGSALTALAPL